MATTNRLVFNPLTLRLALNPYVYHLAFTSFAPKRFAAQTRLVREDDWLFLNFGYEENPPMALPLAESDERNRFFIQQYHRTATQVDLAGKKVLEVSCGHGGGSSYLMRTLGPASYTGLDLNPAAIEFCRGRHTLAGLDFVAGNAQELPFGDGSFDAVLNVEASHLYPDVPRFLAEVARVLTPGGHFLYTDFRRRGRVDEWDAHLAGSGLRLVSNIDVGAEVVRGNEQNTPRKLAVIGRHGGLARFGQEVTDWVFNGAVRTGEFCYRMYHFTKD